MAGITRIDLQRLVGVWLQEGLSPSKVHAIINAVRVLWRDVDLITENDSQLPLDPIRGLRLPASIGGRERVADPLEATRLIQALKPDDRALWATTMYAGLRHGELRALQARDIDLQGRRIHVQRSWDQYEGEIDPKSQKGTRTTIITRPYRSSSLHTCETLDAKAKISSSSVPLLHRLQVPPSTDAPTTHGPFCASKTPLC